MPVTIIGQPCPCTPIVNPRDFVPDWTFGIREATLQSDVEDARAAGAQGVVPLSHKGMGVDLRLASRARGLDAIFGGHFHDAVPVANAGGTTLVTNAGCSGKFLGVMDFEVKRGRVADIRYRLPVFANQIVPDPVMAALIAKARAACGPPRASGSRSPTGCPTVPTRAASRGATWCARHQHPAPR